MFTRGDRLVHAPSWVDQICSHNEKICVHACVHSLGVFVHWGRLVPTLGWCVCTLGRLVPTLIWCVCTLGKVGTYTQLVCSYIGEGWYLHSVGVFVHWGRLVPTLSWCVRTLEKVGTYTQLVCSHSGQEATYSVLTQWRRSRRTGSFARLVTCTLKSQYPCTQAF